MKKKDLFPEVIAIRKRGKCGCPGEKWSSLILSGRQLKKRSECNHSILELNGALKIIFQMRS